LLKMKIEAGVLEHCQSPYRSHWFCVLKKDGKLRIVYNLQQLNSITIRDAGLPPIVDSFVEPFAGHQCYTVMDMCSGFDARTLHPDSRDLTAVSTPLGLLRLTCLPQGFTNSPAEFQKCMQFILKDEIPHIANIFIDDLPIKGPKTQYLDENGHPETLKENPGIRRFIWEHACDVHRIMHRVKCAGVSFAPKKAQICRPEVIIVGHKCTPEGRLPEDDRVEKIQNWPIPTTPKEIRGFLGLCGTVRIWIKDYSLITRPLVALYKKGAEFIWTEECTQAFNTLKDLVSSPPALHPIDYSSDQPVIMSVDTSQIAVGFILSQVDDKGKRRPARYGSLPMNEREARYSQPKLELYGLYRALRHWRIHIIGVKKLTVEVDAKYIKGMLKEPDLQPNAAMNRWIQGILTFDFELVHVPAIKFKGPDALSRRPIAENEEVIEDDEEWLDKEVMSCRKRHLERLETPQVLKQSSPPIVLATRD
jgi:RNase H-like domain found in reverse transcriptase